MSTTTNPDDRISTSRTSPASTATSEDDAGGMVGATSRPLDTTIEVVTPENIAFEYQLAGPFRRLPAYLIDILVRYGIIAALALTLVFVVGMIDVDILGSFAFGAGLVSYFLISWFYGAALETYFNGRTVGKWMFGIRVIDVDGCPITGRRAIIRNLLRIADLAPMSTLPSLAMDMPPMLFIPTGIVGMISVICTRRMQRLGDIAAGTMVIVDEKTWRLPVAKIEDPRVAPLASFVPGDYLVSRSMARTLAIYAERRHYLTPGRRAEIARHLAIPLIERFDFVSDVDFDLLMLALYYRTFLADPSDEPADLGPLAGYSPLRRDQNRVIPAAV
ncbi:putative RDD family membrane protein YckC [Rhodopirellula rubra]|uniref:Putative RDD family membrane protein YckC n=2 Tax=Aporhodopirellula rubra TaxID=980271 RepID=A0A7W5H8N7_9BACT|nr:putative RDD family membrane protein YckC [Aporhodopirellula rubra]